VTLTKVKITIGNLLINITRLLVCTYVSSGIPILHCLDTGSPNQCMHMLPAKLGGAQLRRCAATVLHISHNNPAPPCHTACAAAESAAHTPAATSAPGSPSYTASNCNIPIKKYCCVCAVCGCCVGACLCACVRIKL